jgi:hypothetical protein
MPNVGASQEDRHVAGRGAAARDARPAPLRELALLALLYVGYSAARLVGSPDLRTATDNARTLLDLEARLHLDFERWGNAVTTAAPWLALSSSYWYALLHYVVTPAVLVWVYRRRPGRYREARNALVVASAVGLVGFALLPMAPPRMLPGYVDTLAATAEHGWWGENASAPRGLGSLTNELAAMPSLHVGWALWCTWVVFLCTQRSSVRLLAVVYTLGTTLVVVATANHYVLDAVAGAAVIAFGFLVAQAVTSRSGRRADGEDAPGHVLPAPQPLGSTPRTRGQGGVVLVAQRQHLAQAVGQVADVAPLEAREVTQVGGVLALQPGRDLGQSRVPGDQGRAAARGGLRGDHPECLGEDRRGHAHVGERPEVGQVTVLERPGEQHVRAGRGLERGSFGAEAHDHRAGVQPP